MRYDETRFSPSPNGAVLVISENSPVVEFQTRVDQIHILDFHVKIANPASPRRGVEFKLGDEDLSDFQFDFSESNRKSAHFKLRGNGASLTVEFITDEETIIESGILTVATVSEF